MLKHFNVELTLFSVGGAAERVFCKIYVIAHCSEQNTQTLTETFEGQL